MSISYEEALGTLTAMFGDPWTEESLDAVLRHYKGHMENTVEAVLAHGDGDPQVLLEKLKSGGTAEADTALDAALARQLAQEERRGSARRSSSSRTTTTTSSQPAPSPPPPPPPKGRGTPTELPPDFLRIPGMPIPTTSANAGTTDQDEALARMLQDELFAQELRNNPEFAHLARGRPRTVGGRPVGMRSHVGEMPRRASATSNPHHEGPNILDKISGTFVVIFVLFARCMYSHESFVCVS